MVLTDVPPIYTLPQYFHQSTFYSIVLANSTPRNVHGFGSTVIILRGNDKYGLRIKDRALSLAVEVFSHGTYRLSVINKMNC